MREAIVTGIQVAITFAVLIGLVAVVALFISWAWSNRSAPTLTTPATVQPVPTIRIDMPPSYNRFRDGDVSACGSSYWKRTQRPSLNAERFAFCRRDNLAIRAVRGKRCPSGHGRSTSTNARVGRRPQLRL